MSADLATSDRFRVLRLHQNLAISSPKCPLTLDKKPISTHQCCTHVGRELHVVLRSCMWSRMRVPLQEQYRIIYAPLFKKYL